VKKFPWLSLSLLLAAYSTFSWFLYQITAPWRVWLAVFAFSMMQALLLTTLLKDFRLFMRKWLRSDIGYFSIVLLIACSIAFVLVWYHVFAYFLLVLSAELLSRLDLQTAGLNEWQSLGVLTFVSLAGLAIGWSAWYLQVAHGMSLTVVLLQYFKDLLHFFM
jgi:hypothetical protein